MSTWHVDKAQIVFVVLLRREGTDLMDHQGAGRPWSFWSETLDGRPVEVRSYRSRMLVSLSAANDYRSVNDFIESELLPLHRAFTEDLLPRLLHTTSSDGEPSWFPLVVAPRFFEERQRSSPHDFSSEAVTSFAYRIFDGRSGRIGYIRISRFFVLGLGLNQSVVDELINLLYERILYPLQAKGGKLPRGKIEAELARGLAAYTAPTELNLYVQGLAIRASVFLGVLGLGITVATTLTDGGSPNERLMGLGLAVLLTVLIMTADNFRRRP